MKIQSIEKKEKNQKPFILEEEKEEKKHLTADDINALIEKYKDTKPKPTIIGKEPYDPFLAGITEDTWMSVGDEFKFKDE